MFGLITPLDGSHFAESALETSARLAVRLDAVLELVHVIGTVYPDEQTAITSTDEARRYLQDVASRYAPRIRVRTHVLEGQPVDEILRMSHTVERSMVVMSRFGRSGLRRTHFGRVADDLIHRSGAPVLLIDPRHPAATSDFKEILVPLDGSALASTALPLAVDIAGPRGRLCLTRVVTPPDIGARSPDGSPSVRWQPETDHDLAAVAVNDARDYLFRRATELRRQGAAVSWEVRFGEPGNEILRAAETGGVDLIVIATHGWGEVRRWAFGSVTDAVIQGGTTPVLVVPPAVSRQATPSEAANGGAEPR